MTSGNKFKSYFFLFHLLGACAALPSYAQNICTNLPAGAVTGDFELSGNVYAGCSPFNTIVVDKSGGTDIRYDFYYTKKTPAQLDTTGNLSASNAYFVNTATSVYTILQYGKKNGQKMYACKNVTVRPNNKPKFSFSQCGSSVEIAVPKASENYYEYYEITWNNNLSTKVKIDSSQLPFAISKTVTFPSDLKVEGFPKGPVGCTAVNNQTALALTPANYPNGFILPYDPNIDQLEMPNKGSAILTFRGSENPLGYNLNIRDNIPNSSFSLFKSGVKPGEIKVDIPDSTKSYCFYLTRSICNEYTSEVCTIPQKEIPIIADNKIELNWHYYPNNINNRPITPLINTLDKIVSIEKKEGNTITEVGVLSNDTKFSELISTCLKGVFYRVKIKVSGFLQGYKYNSLVYSNWEEVKANILSPTAITDLVATVTNNNGVKIEFTNNSNWAIPVKRFYLNNSLLQKIDSVNAAFTSFNEIATTDALNQCFTMGFVDNCANISKLSPEVCPTYLSALENDDLEWSLKSPFGLDIIKEFELISVDEKSGVEFSNGIFKSNENSTSPNYDGIETEAKFKIKVIGIGGNESFSNTIIIPIQATFFLPSAFSPNFDSVNDILELKGRFGRVKELKLEIYNRWGQKVGQINDKTEKWDGKVKGISVPAGVYYYKLNVSLSNGEKVYQEGNIELLR